MKRKVRLLVVPGLLSLTLLVLYAMSGPTSMRTVAAKPIPGTVVLTGTVDAPKPFQAAKVFVRNMDKHMLYMVYTEGGHYEAVELFPGNYELSVVAEGLESDVQKLVLKPGENATANVTLHEQSAQSRNRVDLLPYSQVYPAGSELKIAERLCIRCHGPNFLPSRQWSADQWNGAIDLMKTAGNIQPEELTDADRQMFVKYLVANFGPDSKPRGVVLDVKQPLDEKKISKAEYIEYYLPVDGPNEGVHAPEYKDMKGPFTGKRVSQDLLIDNDGNVWITDRAPPNRLAKLDTHTQTITDFITPEPKAGLHDLYLDHTGMLWLPESNDGQIHMFEFDPKTEKWIGTYDMDPGHVIPQPWHAQSLVEDQQGNLEIGFIMGNGVAVWDREANRVTNVYQPPTPNSWPYGFARDSKNNIWFAEFHGSKVAKFDPKTDKFTEYASPTPALIRRLCVDEKDNIWFGLFSAAKMDYLETKTGKITEIPIPSSNSAPYNMVPTKDGKKLWFSDGGQGGAMVLMDIKTRDFTFYPTPQRTDMPKIRLAADGSVWYAPRTARNAAAGVLYPDKTKINSLVAVPGPPLYIN